MGNDRAICFGFGFRFFDGRLNLNIDYYIKTTKDLLMNADTPASSLCNYPS